MKYDVSDWLCDVCTGTSAAIHEILVLTKYFHYSSVCVSFCPVSKTWIISPINNIPVKIL